MSRNIDPSEVLQDIYSPFVQQKGDSTLKKTSNSTDDQPSIPSILEDINQMYIEENEGVNLESTVNNEDATLDQQVGGGNVDATETLKAGVNNLNEDNVNKNSSGKSKRMKCCAKRGRVQKLFSGSVLAPISQPSNDPSVKVYTCLQKKRKAEDDLLLKESGIGKRRTRGAKNVELAGVRENKRQLVADRGNNISVSTSIQQKARCAAVTGKNSTLAGGRGNKLALGSGKQKKQRSVVGENRTKKIHNRKSTEIVKEIRAKQIEDSKLGKFDEATVSQKRHAVIEVPDDDEGVAVLTPRQNPRTMIRYFETIPESHKIEIRKIGFGAFLDLQLPAQRARFRADLVRSVNVDKLSLIMDDGDKISLEETDFELVYGLPRGGIDIQEPDSEGDAEWSAFLLWWRGLFNLKCGSPHLKTVLDELERLKKEPCCKEFLLHFVICVVNCCIRSTTNLQLNYKFLYSCMKVEDIGKLNWCKFAYRHLFTSAGDWKDGKSYFTGPLPFLMICYFDRLKRGMDDIPRTIPLISVWNEEMITKRLRVEKKNGFGNGTVLPRIQPASNLQPDEAPAKPNEAPSRPAEVGEGSSSCLNDILDFLKEFQEKAKTLVSNVKSMNVILDKARSIFDDGDISVEMDNLIKSIWDKYGRSSDVNMSQEDATAVKSSGSEKEKGKGSPVDKGAKKEDEGRGDIDHAFMAELEVIMNKGYAKLNQEKEKIAKESVNTMSPLSFDLLNPFSRPDEGAIVQSGGPSTSGGTFGGCAVEDYYSCSWSTIK